MTQMMKKLILMMIILLGTTVLLNAQSSNGTLTGQVTDQQNAVVQGANVTIINLETNSIVNTTTNTSGSFSAASLQPGPYQITVEKTGFRTTQVSNVVVLTAQTVTSNVILEVGAANETVQVTSDAPLLTADSPTLATTVETKLIEDIPFTDRSALGAVTLAAGVTGDPQYPDGVQSENPGIFTALITPGGSLQVSGARPGTSSILVDGSDNTLASTPRTGVSFSNETIREVTIQQNGLPAQYGRTGGGIINQSTRAGTKRFYATASWQHNEPKFQARTFGSPVAPAKRQNQESLIASGPVLFPRFGEGGPAVYNGKGRTYFFFSYEPTQLSDVVFSRGRIPTPDELQGRFNNSLENLDQTVLRNQGIDAALAAGRVNTLVYQFALNSQFLPIGPRLSRTQYSRTPIVNNDLSRTLANNPVARYYFSFYPTPQSNSPYARFYRSDGLYDNDGTNAFLARGVISRDQRTSFRIDHRLTSKDNLVARATYVPVNGKRYNFFGPDSPAEPIFSDKTKSLNLIANEVHSFGGSLVNELRLTYTRTNQLRLPIEASLDKDYAATGGLPRSSVGNGFPGLGNLIGGQIGTQANNGAGRTLDTNFGLSDDFSFTRGNHNIKVGGETRLLGFDRLDSSGIYGGLYGFTPSLTAPVRSATNVGNGIGMASFILGAISSINYRSAVTTYKYRWNYYAGYAQDDWKARRNLTINFGLRYNLETPRREKNNLQGSFDPNVTGTLNGLPVKGGFVFSGQNGRGRGIFPTNYLSFEPRLGFAYQPFSKMTVRASYGLIHTPLTGLGVLVTPDLGNGSFTNGAGGVQPSSVAYLNYLTNPLAAISPTLPTQGPLFSFTDGINLPYVDQTNVVPYVQLYSASLQFQITRNAVIEAAYSGQKGTHLFNTPLNYNLPSNARIIQEIQNNKDFNDTTTVGQSPYFVGTSERVRTYYESLRPYQQFYGNGIDSNFDRRASSTYNALYLSFKQRLTKGTTVTASYSFSKSIDDFSSGFPETGQAAVVDIFAPGRTQNPENLKAERSVSTFDIPHKFSLGFSTDIPIGRGKTLNIGNKFVDAIFNGVIVSGTFLRQSGYPLQLYLGSYNGTNVSNNNGYFCSTSPGGTLCDRGQAVQDLFVRPNIVQGVPLINPAWDKNNPLAAPYINRAAFSIPGSQGNPDFGNAPRTLPYLRTPTTQFFNTTIRKRIKLFGEQSKHFVELRADVFNILNRNNLIFGTGSDRRSLYNGPGIGTGTASPAFGFLEQAPETRGRTLRLGVKVAF